MIEIFMDNMLVDHESQICYNNSMYNHCAIMWWGVDWNRECARAIEVFGCPGDRYTTHAMTDHMLWRFRDRGDLLLFLTGWPVQPYQGESYEC